MKKYLVFIGLLVSVVLIAVSGCTTTTSSSNPAPAPAGTTSIEVGALGAATLTAGGNDGTASIVVVDQDNNPINSTSNLNIQNITVQIWSTSATTQSATASTITYTGGSSGSDITYGLTLDRSGSMGSKSGTVNQSLEAAAVAFISGSNAADEGCVVNFSTAVTVDQGITTDKALLINAVTGESTYRDLTALYNSIITGVTTVATGSHSRKALIAMTDGYNTTGTATLTDAINAAISLGIPVYTVGLGAGISTSILSQIASDTGGLFYNAPTSADLLDLYNKISSALSSSWSITFTSPVTFVTSTTYYILITVTYEGGITNSVLYTVTL